MQRGLLLDAVAGQREAILKLLAGEAWQPKCVGTGPARLSLMIANGAKRLFAISVVSIAALGPGPRRSPL
jgi:hypothetical protein